MPMLCYGLVKFSIDSKEEQAEVEDDSDEEEM